MSECPLSSQHECDQAPRDCELCMLGEAEWTLESSLHAYIEAVNKYIKKLKEKKDDNI